MSSSSRQDNSSSSAKSSSSAESSRMQCPDIPSGALAEQPRGLREVVEALCKISLGPLPVFQILGTLMPDVFFRLMEKCVFFISEISG